MSPALSAIGILGWLWLAAILQFGLADRLAIFGVAPDLLLVSVAVIGLYSRPAVGARVGFVASLIQGCVAGANLAHYALSRTITGVIVSSSRNWGFEIGVVLAGILTMAATIFAQTMLMILAPPPGIGSFLGATMLQAMYNGVLAMPLYALMKRLVKSSAD